MKPTYDSAEPRQSRRPTRMLVCAALFATLAPSAAFAYLDPSTGSMVVSAIVGIFASIALAVKTYWYRIKAFFRRGDKSAAARESTQETARKAAPGDRPE